MTVLTASRERERPESFSGERLRSLTLPARVEGLARPREPLRILAAVRPRTRRSAIPGCRSRPRVRPEGRRGPPASGPRQLQPPVPPLLDGRLDPPAADRPAGGQPVGVSRVMRVRGEVGRQGPPLVPGRPGRPVGELVRDPSLDPRLAPGRTAAPRCPSAWYPSNTPAACGRTSAGGFQIRSAPSAGTVTSAAVVTSNRSASARGDLFAGRERGPVRGGRRDLPHLGEDGRGLFQEQPLGLGLILDVGVGIRASGWGIADSRHRQGCRNPEGHPLGHWSFP